MLQNIGLSEFVLIAIAALILFGPDKMPEIGRKVGKAVRELRSVTAAFLADATRDPEQRRSAASGTAEPTVTATSAATERATPAAQPAPGAAEAAPVAAAAAPGSTSAVEAGAGSAVPAAVDAASSAPDGAASLPVAPPVPKAATAKPQRAADPRRLPE